MKTESYNDMLIAIINLTTKFEISLEDPIINYHDVMQQRASKDECRQKGERPTNPKESYQR
ncbi:hypothetical protein ACU8KH_01812 [Lachancea thermotolerans]